MQWLRRTIAGSPDRVQIMYGISGERMLAEQELKSLPGYEKSSPVRIGNAASKQLQLDLYGEVLDAFFCAYGKLEPVSAEDFALLRLLVEHLETIWEKPDEGIWEVRGGPQHFTYSKVMAWVAFDRAIKIAESSKLDLPVTRWRNTRDIIHKQVCEKAFDKRLNSFVQHYGSKQLDASVLLIALVGFLPPEDPRIRGTVEAIERYLIRDGLVMRYATSTTDDGLPGSEGKFLACSFWLVSNLKLIGREADALRLFERLLSWPMTWACSLKNTTPSENGLSVTFHRLCLISRLSELHITSRNRKRYSVTLRALSSIRTKHKHRQRDTHVQGRGRS